MVKKLIQRKYDELGAMTFHEIATLILFIACVLLWFFRDPQFITGWAELLPAAYEKLYLNVNLYFAFTVSFIFIGK